MVQLALDQPIDTLRVEKMVAKGQRVAVLVDDHTRKTPIQRMLPPLLDRLDAAGVREADICIVLALGSHRAMNTVEVESKLGGDIASRYEIINTSGSDRSHFKDLGSTSNGIPLCVHRRVAEADARIGLGSITPHMDAGFSGGAKILLPGVCCDQTIDAFHLRSALSQWNPLGDANAVLRLDLEQAVTELAPLDFVLNSIPTLAGDCYMVVAGHPVHAQRTGAGYARRVFQALARRKYPVVLACCHPYEHDLWQSMKGLWCGDLLTADGGSLILLTAAREGSQQTPLLPGYIGADPQNLMRSLDSGAAADLKSAATGLMVSHIKERIHISLVSDGLTRTEVQLMGLSYFKSVEGALEQAVGGLQPAEKTGSIGVIPEAGLVLPVIDHQAVE
jgi:nickel-dependent lactate racemase